MDGRPTWTDCDKAGEYVVPNVLSPRDLVFRPDNMDETVPHTHVCFLILYRAICTFRFMYPSGKPDDQWSCKRSPDIFA